MDLFLFIITIFIVLFMVVFIWSEWSGSAASEHEHPDTKRIKYHSPIIHPLNYPSKKNIKSFIELT
jgi:ABC-type cobalt transport system substrate-binding protein